MAYRHVLEDLLDLRLPLLFRDLGSKGGWVDRRSVGDFDSACWAHVGEGVARLRPVVYARCSTGAVCSGQGRAGRPRLTGRLCPTGRLCSAGVVCALQGSLLYRAGPGQARWRRKGLLDLRLPLLFRDLELAFHEHLDADGLLVVRAEGLDQVLALSGDALLEVGEDRARLRVVEAEVEAEAEAEAEEEVETEVETEVEAEEEEEEEEKVVEAVARRAPAAPRPRAASPPCPSPRRCATRARCCGTRRPRSACRISCSAPRRCS